MSNLKLLKFESKKEEKTSTLTSSLIILPANVSIIIQNQNSVETEAPGGGKVTTLITENHKFEFNEDSFLIPSSQMKELFEGFDFKLLELKKGGLLSGTEKEKEKQE